VVKPFINTLDLVRRPRNVWIVDFGVDMPLDEAAEYEEPFKYVVETVKPVRDGNRDRRFRERWWLHGRPRVDMRRALAPLDRYLSTPTVSKHRVFRWLTRDVYPDHQLIVFARQDDYFFGVLHS